MEKTAAIGTRAGQVARAVATGVGESLAEQTARVWTGQQDSIHWEQTLGAAVSGGLLGHATVGGSDRVASCPPLRVRSRHGSFGKPRVCRGPLGRPGELSGGGVPKSPEAATICRFQHKNTLRRRREAIVKAFHASPAPDFENVR